jgi:hypothetical protein
VQQGYEKEISELRDRVVALAAVAALAPAASGEACRIWAEWLQQQHELPHQQCGRVWQAAQQALPALLSGAEHARSARRAEGAAAVVQFVQPLPSAGVWVDGQWARAAAARGAQGAPEGEGQAAWGAGDGAPPPCAALAAAPVRSGNGGNGWHQHPPRGQPLFIDDVVALSSGAELLRPAVSTAR